MTFRKEMNTECGDHVFIAANIPFSVTGDYGDTVIQLTENNDDEACAVFSKEDLQKFIAMLTERYNEIV